MNFEIFFIALSVSFSMVFEYSCKIAVIIGLGSNVHILNVFRFANSSVTNARYPSVPIAFSMILWFSSVRSSGVFFHSHVS